LTDRIKELVKLTLNGEMYVEPIKTEFDRMDLLLPEDKRDVKRLCEYIVNQEPKITAHSALTGYFRFDGSVVGDAFHRSGHKKTGELLSQFYLKAVDNLSTLEWQHAAADYRQVLANGISGIIKSIEVSLTRHNEESERDFLLGLTDVANAMIAYSHKCSKRAAEFAEGISDSEGKARLLRLSETLMRVPQYAPKSFYEAVLTLYLCFSADPDSIGTLDRYLTPFYENDIKNGTLTYNEAKEYLQELFLMIQAKTDVRDGKFTRGGESHFAVGGYLPNGEDAFNEVTRLIIESLTDMPIYCPQITFRWTAKTPHEVLKYVMDRERRDKNKRIAFTNDEKRIKCYTELCGFSFEDAVNYTTVGCNEPAFCGGITGGTSKINLLRSTSRLFNEESEKIENAQSFDEFYSVFEKELCDDLQKGLELDDKYNLVRARDNSYISSLFFNGPIENAKSLTRGGLKTVIVAPMLLGITNVIDSLCVVKQFVFDEGLITLKELIKEVQANWQGDLRTVLLKKCDFFGNDGTVSNAMALRLYTTLYSFLKDKKSVFGYQYLVGDLLGYNNHHVWFGKMTGATPDGRYSGEPLKFGIGQSEGKDREGLTALLNSIAKCDPYAIACGSTVTNISLDKKLIQNDDNFEKTVDLFEAYFLNGGVHFQLTYVSAEDLKNARIEPQKYQSLRVRVTGFSDYYVRLSDGIQDDILKRTVKEQ